MIYEDYDYEETGLRRVVERVCSPLYNFERRILRWLEVRECTKGGHVLRYARSYIHEVSGYYGPSFAFMNEPSKDVGLHLQFRLAEKRITRREVDFKTCDCGLKTRHFFTDTGAEVSPQEMISAFKQNLNDSTRMFAFLPKEPWKPSA